MSIGETVEEVTDSGFMGTTPTLSCSQLGDDALVQVSMMHISLYPLFSIGEMVEEVTALFFAIIARKGSSTKVKSIPIREKEVSLL